jgi:hypothetical protein
MLYLHLGLFSFLNKALHFVHSGHVIGRTLYPQRQTLTSRISECDCIGKWGLREEIQENVPVKVGPDPI